MKKTRFYVSRLLLSCSVFAMLFLFASSTVFSQMPYNPGQSLGIEYRSKENPYYWKNRLPRDGYWQQDIHYKIQAELNDQTRTISGHQILVYFNNSPDTLDHVYFHLYQNAFRKGSYDDQMRRSNGNNSLSNLPKSAEGGTDIDKIVDGYSQPLETKLDNTILWVKLNQQLLPGDSTIFEIDFKTFFGTIRRRMKYNPSFGIDQFTATQWYPRISVYDSKFGWTTDQHLGHEFYGDFGTYEVDLTLPNNYIVAATGYLLNRDEVLPPELMEKLDIKNFADKPYRERPSEIIPKIPDSSKTWRYKAINVHDFAWTADPSYRIGTAEWDGIKCYAFAREWKAARWQDAAQFTAEVIRVYSTDFGRYGYHKMIVADADDGMEYPMITMDGGTSPGYYGLLAHEVGHNWFFGMVGNNETYRALLDEGFTSFITSWSMTRLVHQKGKPGEENFEYENTDNEPWGNYYSYFATVKSGADAPLTIHSDKYNLTTGGANIYGEVYYKTVVMLFGLQYVLGDDQFQQAMSHYFNQWKFCHPYTEDFRHSIIDYTKWDLNWFFDEWLNHAYAVDYALQDFKPVQSETGWQAVVKVKRKGKAIMPIDLQFQLADGSSALAVIPVDDHAKHYGNPIVLPKWTGWGDFNTTYTTTVILPAEPVSVEIDPSGRLGDIYQLDNYLSLLPRIQLAPAWKRHEISLDKYTIQWHPNLWYNTVDGLRVGVNLDGGYLNFTGFGEHQLDFSPNIGANFPQNPLSYSLRWREPLHALPLPTYFSVSSRIQTGYMDHSISIAQELTNQQFRRNDSKTLQVGIHFTRHFANDYLWAPALWNDRPLNMVELTYSDRYYYGANNSSSGNFRIELMNSLGGTPSQFSKVVLESVQKVVLGKLDIRLRGILGYATTGVPPQAAFYRSTGSPIDWITNPWYAAKGTLPVNWTDDGHVQPAGGGNLRGYNETDFSQITDLAMGQFVGANRLAAANLEIGLWNPIDDILFKIPAIGKYLQIDLYGFADVGTVNFVSDDQVFAAGDKALWDAGFGVYWNPALSWRTPSFIRNLLRDAYFRFDFPIYVSDPSNDEDEVEFRWLLGFGRAF